MVGMLKMKCGATPLLTNYELLGILIAGMSAGYGKNWSADPGLIPGISRSFSGSKVRSGLRTRVSFHSAIQYRKEEFTMGFFSKLFGKADAKKNDEIFAPIAGQAVPVTEVPDPTFSSGMLGNGVAILPTDGKVYAPCNATVDMMFTTGHAVSLVADCGAEILIHVGLETVGLEGKCFTVHVQNGQKVKKGDLMIEVDLEGVKAAGLNTITPILICNTDDYPTFVTHEGKNVTNADVVIELAK